MQFPDKRARSWRLEKKRWRSKMRKDRQRCTIYGLYDNAGKLRYIGQTRQIVRERVKCFMKSIRRSIERGHSLSPVERWIFDSVFAGERIEAKIITDNATWDISEIIEIERAKSRGEKLLNVLRGGNDSLKAVRREVYIEPMQTRP